MRMRAKGLVVTGLLLTACGGTQPEPRDEPLPSIALPVAAEVIEADAASPAEPVTEDTSATPAARTLAGWRIEDLPPIPVPATPAPATEGDLEAGTLAAAVALATASGLPGLPSDPPALETFTEQEINDVLVDPVYGDQAETLDVRWSDEFEEPIDEFEIGETVIEIDGTEVRCQGTMEVVTTVEEYDVVVVNDRAYDPGWDPVYDPDYGSWDYGYWVVEGPYDADRFGHGHHDHHDDHHGDRHGDRHGHHDEDDVRGSTTVYKKPRVTQGRRRQARRPDGSILLGSGPQARRAERERVHETPSKLVPDPVTVAKAPTPTFRGAVRPGEGNRGSRGGHSTAMADTVRSSRQAPGTWNRVSRRHADPVVTTPTPTRIQPTNTNITSTTRINPHPTRSDPHVQRVDPRPKRYQTPKPSSLNRTPPPLNQPGPRIRPAPEKKREVKRRAPERRRENKVNRREPRKKTVTRRAPKPAPKPRAERPRRGGNKRVKTVEAPPPPPKKQRSRKRKQ